jgi:hypothetical protein
MLLPLPGRRGSYRSRHREMTDLGKILVGFGIVVIVLGGILWLAGHFTGKVPWLGRLPGDIYIERGNWRFYFPLGTSIVVSIVLSLLLGLFSRR